MGQLLIRNVDDELKEALRARARRHGRSLEAEARATLAESLVEIPRRGFGSAVVRLFRDDPYEPGEIEEARLHGWQTPDFDRE